VLQSEVRRQPGASCANGLRLGLRGAECSWVYPPFIGPHVYITLDDDSLSAEIIVLVPSKFAVYSSI
jgi:hypothetical protein